MEKNELHTFRDTYEYYELSEPSTDSLIRVAPERGGLLTSFIYRGHELLYMDNATLLDPEANVRGGNPILFPISGQLDGGSYEWNGTTYTMPQHGIARNRAWQVVKADSASIQLRLSNDTETEAAFPFRFELIFTYALRNGSLTIDQVYRNLSDQAMPMYAGFHPYFAADRKNIAYETDATRYYDYNDGKEKPYDGSPLDIGSLKESVVFLNAENREIAFSPDGRHRIRMTYGNEFKYVVLWSVENKKFICVEPWMAIAGELNRKKELLLVPAGDELTTSLAIECELL